ncbi:MAG TPA: hypothetical protein DEB30_02385 [Candidatus Peribacter riflensis]|uniref:Uncharacterized protein n=1 Tax=Candidatus Peribacter riflensis TaxID=1735162 RepID=A0A0S1SN54_9BACT|nr:MAG: hypothetical protein PeribacterA2_0494 [Candidatus Peribacter riflensis]OGJ77034.1 MAG: hypothetical protein A2398_02785 [Candidatus Peribacteria bacterium RIFOXYB1_FULL_57_12]OGJ80884.1 MAG: hypothetical protein A2412_01750 [Candidatus Peribacteria bacterium RIFOXYC1_FULL_58_8]ALM10978.1 MAG: hypothetical protein PeribacterB2_0493 [Candidatus Peribacter riflensis]ALM12081.1 MAG: hypothetical protein PeribacterC2_0493 [Candidatus Peribacter riflensis]
MVEEPKAVNSEPQADAPHPAVGEIGAAIRAEILQTCTAHPLWQKLTALREAGEVAREDFGYEQVREVFEESRSIARKDVGNRALVLMATDAEQFHEISYIDANGDEQAIDPESVNGVLILLPKDFGDAR